VLDEVRSFLKGVDRQNGKLWVLVTALGAGEYWGSNSNGDYFPESSLIHTPEGWADLEHKMQKMVGRNWEWGYPTFYNAYAYAHHQNKDPRRAFGDVEYSCWDPVMKRVLLVLSLDRDKSRREGSIGVIDRIDNGEYPDLSMGCKVPFDVCSACGEWKRITGNPKRDLAEHKKSAIRGLSVTTADYCQHLRFENGKIYPDGRKVWMWNLHPRFFDISFVFVGADKSSKVMAKLSGLCPLRPDHRQCSKGCWECDIPSSHVHDVWDREMAKTAETAFPEYEDDWVSPRTEKALSTYLDKKRKSVKTSSYADAIDTSSPAAGASKLSGLGAIKEAFSTGTTKLADLDLAKKAEIIKRIQSHFNTALPSIEAEEPPIPTDTLDEMSRHPGHGLGTAAGMGIVLRPREFQRVMLVGMGRRGLADELDHRGVCFRCGSHLGADHLAGPALDDIIPRIIEALSPLIRSRSAFGPPLMRRSLQVIVISKPREDDAIEGPERSLQDHPLLDKLGEEYAAYRRALMYKTASAVSRLVHEHPRVLEGIVESDPFQKGGPGIVKHAEDVVQSLLGMFPAMYLNRAYLPGPASRYVADRPSFAGLREAGALAASGGVA
jgi:hypothetical protein